MFACLVVSCTVVLLSLAHSIFLSKPAFFVRSVFNGTVSGSMFCQLMDSSKSIINYQSIVVLSLSLSSLSTVHTVHSQCVASFTELGELGIPAIVCQYYYFPLLPTLSPSHPVLVCLCAWTCLHCVPSFLLPLPKSSLFVCWQPPQKHCLYSFTKVVIQLVIPILWQLPFSVCLSYSFCQVRFAVSFPSPSFFPPLRALSSLSVHWPS